MHFKTVNGANGQRRRVIHSGFCSLHTSMPGLLESKFGAKGMSGESFMSACLIQQKQKGHVSVVCTWETLKEVSGEFL